jgi:hypothetical protein
MTHIKLHMDTLILIPTFKIYMFSYSRQMDRLTDGRRHPLRVGWRNLSKTAEKSSSSPCAALLAHRNRYLEGMDGRQKTPRGHPDFIFYVQQLCVFIFQTDGLMDREIHPVWAG